MLSHRTPPADTNLLFAQRRLHHVRFAAGVPGGEVVASRRPVLTWALAHGIHTATTLTAPTEVTVCAVRTRPAPAPVVSAAISVSGHRDHSKVLRRWG